MCGISGFVDFTKKSSSGDLDRMNQTLLHRGPDGGSTALKETSDAHIGFAHRRLSIIDLSEGGKQPMQFEHLTITYNGEIYNFGEIRQELEQKGHTFHSHSDTEVILHGYAEWGAQVVDKFIGMFAFVIYDEKKQEIICYRDRAGVKPFFYYWHNNLFLFGSELKAILSHPSFEKSIHHDAIASFLQFGYIPHPHCIYKHTYKLSPGHSLLLDLKTKQYQVSQYWSVYDAYNKPKKSINFEDAVDETEKLLTSAFNYRMVSDVPVGIFLSGGYDSSTVAALLQSHSSSKVKTFTIGFEDQQLNEAPYAKQVAQLLGTEHIEYSCTEKEALDIVPKLPYYFDEPFADSSAIPTTLVSKIAKEHVTVALSADAGDEIFAGYNRYDYMIKYGGRMKSISPWIRTAMTKTMDMINPDQLPVVKNHYNFKNRFEKIKRMLRTPDDYHLNLLLSVQFNQEEAASLLNESVKPLHTAFDSKKLSEATYDSLSYIMAMDYETYLVDDILQKVDRATMTHSLEGREPFLDHRVIEWAASLPMDYKYHHGNKKYILKEIAHRYLPKDLMQRPKMGFSIPIAKWLRGDLKVLVDHYLNETYLLKQGLFNPPRVKKLVDDFYSFNRERAERIWYLLMFQMWYEQWMQSSVST